MNGRNHDDIERWLREAQVEFAAFNTFAVRYRAIKAELSDVLARVKGMPTEIVRLVATEANLRYKEQLAELDAEVRASLAPRAGETPRAMVMRLDDEIRTGHALREMMGRIWPGQREVLL